MRAPVTAEPGWWENRAVVAGLILLAAVPLLYPDIPPLVDLFGHMGRYRVQLDIGSSPSLQQYYTFRWAAIGNLGVDLLVIPLRPLFGLEGAVKLIVIMIPPLTVAGFLWVAREVHGRIPPTTMFAVPFALNFPFLYGFVNFALSMALALLAFALWLRLGRMGRTRLRAVLFVPISIVIFFVHAFGWGALGLLCFSDEAVRLHDRGRPWLRAGIEAATHVLVMALPLLIMVGWRNEAHSGSTFGWFDWRAKLTWLFSALRDRWQLFDVGSMLVAAFILVFAAMSGKLAISRNLGFSGFVLLITFLLLPQMVFGSGFADMRLVPYLIAVLLIAIRLRSDWAGRMANILAIAGFAFLVMRVAGTTASLAIAADEQDDRLAALEHIPRGARVATFVGRPCAGEWKLPRNTHLGAMVIVRREGFSNDQWIIEGVNLLGLNYRGAGRFAADATQIVQPDNCSRPEHWSLNYSLAHLPRDGFDFVWLIDPLPFDEELVRDMKLVWRGEGSILYQLPKRLRS